MSHVVGLAGNIEDGNGICHNTPWEFSTSLLVFEVWDSWGVLRADGAVATV
jgi:hypothetical protein